MDASNAESQRITRTSLCFSLSFAHSLTPDTVGLSNARISLLAYHPVARENENLRIRIHARTHAQVLVTKYTTNEPDKNDSYLAMDASGPPFCARASGTHLQATLVLVTSSPVEF